MTKYVTKPQQVTIQEIHFTGTLSVENLDTMGKIRTFIVTPGNVIVFRTGVDPVLFSNIAEAVKTLDLQEIPSGPIPRQPFTDPVQVDMQGPYKGIPIPRSPAPPHPYDPERPARIWCSGESKTFLAETQPQVVAIPRSVFKKP